MRALDGALLGRSLDVAAGEPPCPLEAPLPLRHLLRATVRERASVCRRNDVASCRAGVVSSLDTLLLCRVPISYRAHSHTTVHERSPCPSEIHSKTR